MKTAAKVCIYENLVGPDTTGAAIKIVVQQTNTSPDGGVVCDGKVAAMALETGSCVWVAPCVMHWHEPDQRTAKAKHSTAQVGEHQLVRKVELESVKMFSWGGEGVSKILTCPRNDAMKKVTIRK